MRILRLFPLRNFCRWAFLFVATGSVAIGLAVAPACPCAAPWLLMATLVSLLLGWLLAFLFLLVRPSDERDCTGGYMEHRLVGG